MAGSVPASGANPDAGGNVVTIVVDEKTRED
jgi:hypothetical protein